MSDYFLRVAIAVRNGGAGWSVFALSFFGAMLTASESVTAAEPASVYWGGVELIPQLELVQSYDDNLLNQRSEELSSWVTEITPAIAARLQTTTLGVEVSLENRTGIYRDSSTDNFSDYLADVTLIWQPNHRNHWQWISQYHDLHEQRGTGYSQGIQALLLEEPNEYNDIRHQLSYTYGAETARGRLQFQLDRNERDYTNNAALAERRDRDISGGSATFYWLLGGRTYVLVQGRYNDIDYVTDPIDIAGEFDTLDAESSRAFVGASWEATGKTRGTLKVGQARRTFDDADRKTFTGLSWEGELEWTPKEYSVFSLSTSREDRETDSQADFIDVSQVNISWTHAWRTRFSSKIFAAAEVLDYQGEGVAREDEVNRVGVTLIYNMRRWLDWSLSVAQTEKTSDIDSLEYERRVVSLGVNISL